MENLSIYLNDYESRRYADEKFRITFHTDRVFLKGFEKHNELNLKNNITESRAHWHEAIEILRIKSGSGILYLGVENIAMHSGDIIVINTNELHRIRAFEEACVYDCLTIEYSTCLEWGIDLYTHTYKTLIQSPCINAVFDKIAEEYYAKNGNYKMMVTGLCMQIIALLTRSYTVADKTQDFSSQKKIELVQRIMQYIAKHYSSRQILDEISNAFKYNKFYLAHIFIEFTGMSIKEYQMQKRFSAAKKLLNEKTLSIGDIAFQCGYHSAASFSAEFHKRFSETPSQYRKRIL